MALSAGDRIGSYEIVSRLGAGGMGVVYRAHDSKLERDVAVKVLSAKGATDSDRLRRFEQEARAASALDHPNIITIHEIGETDDGQPFIVMQLVEGKSLRELIDARRLGLNETLRIATQIADGLARAHREGIIHRDLKPDNVMVTDDGLVKILDFGLAKLAEPAVGSELATIDRKKPQTAEGRIVGTVQYMSPEQAQGESVDARSDIFSFGALLYEMLTGRRPFRGDNAVALLADIVSRDPERASALEPSLPVDLDKIVHRSLQKDPERRFQHADDIKVALQELHDELACGDALTARDVRALGRTRKPWSSIAATLLAIVAVAALIVLPRLPDDPPLRIVPVTTDAGYEIEPALSPDGRKIAFAKDETIYVKLIGEAEAIALTGGEEWDASPAWSPDGARVAFLGHRSATTHDVFEVPAVGGTPRLVGKADGGHGLSYSPDGKYIALGHKESPDEPDSIFLLSRDTGELRRLTSPPVDTPHRVDDRFPRFSPDGRRIAFTRVLDGTYGAGELLIYEVSTGRTSVFAESRGMVRGLDFSSDGDHVVYSIGPSFDSLHLEITAVDAESTSALLPGERATAPSLARTANRLAYVRELDDWNIWRASGPAAQERLPPQQIVASTWHDMTPELSPDGTTLAFMSGRSGAWEIWLAQADGSSAQRLTDLGHAATPRWSPDGAQIAFESAAAGSMDVLVIDAEGGFPRNLTQSELDDGGPMWSADGKHIFYVSHRDGERQVWKISSDGGDGELVLTDAAFAWPLDNDELLFSRSQSVWSMRGRDRAVSEVLRLHGPTSRWAPWRDQLVFFNRDNPNGRSIDVLNRSTGNVSTLVELEEGALIPRLTVSVTGEWVFYQQRDTTGSDIMLVENFRVEP